MRIDPSQSSSLQSYGVEKKRAVVPASSAQGSSTSSVSSVSDSSEDIAKVKETVKRLMSESAVRTEKVAGRTAEDPVKAFDETTLRRFVASLREE